MLQLSSWEAQPWRSSTSRPSSLSYTAEKAAQVVDELVRRVERLQDHPQLGRVVPEYGRWQLRELVDKWNRVLYRLRPDAIEVVTIVPARMPLDELDPDE